MNDRNQQPVPATSSARVVDANAIATSRRARARGLRRLVDSSLRSLALVLACASASAQEPKEATQADKQQPPAAVDASLGPTEQLRSMLDQLRTLDAAAWKARAAELEAAAAALDRAAQEKREQSKRLLAEVEAMGEKARALRKEREQLAELQKLLGTLPTSAASKPAANASATAKPAAAQPKPDKPAAAPDASKAPAATTPASAPTPPAPASETKKPSEPAKGGEPAKPQQPAAPKPDDKQQTDAAPKAAAPADAAVAAANEATEPRFVVWADVEPIFSEHCVACHDPDSSKGGLDLSSYAAAMQGGGSGKSIVPGEPDQSRLFRMIALVERPFMPKDADALDAKTQGIVRSWIEHGASEDKGAARAFWREREAKAKAAAAAVEAASSGPAPMPEGWPAIAMRTSERASPIAALARSPRGALLAAAGIGQALMLDGGGKLVACADLGFARIGSVGFSPDGKLLAIAGGEAGKNGRALVLDVVTGACVGTFGKERDVPLAVAVHHGARVVAIGGSSKRVRVHSLDRGSDEAAELLWEGKHDDFVLSLAFSPDGSLLAAADRSGACVLWEVDGGAIAQTLRSPQGAAHAVAFHRSGTVVALACGDGTVRAFDPKDGKERWQKKACQGDALAVAFSQKDALAVCGADGKLARFALDGKQLGTSPSLGDHVLGVAFGDDDNVVFGADAQGRLHRWDGKKVEVVAGLRGVSQ